MGPRLNPMIVEGTVLRRSGDLVEVRTLPLTNNVTWAFELICALASCPVGIVMPSVCCSA